MLDFDEGHGRMSEMGEMFGGSGWNQNGFNFSFLAMLGGRKSKSNGSDKSIVPS